ncbi:MAG: scyllo-inositol 2-dehydrogenase (NADP(+)) IolU [Candidatus Celerinatantimonas neptuna]|nr:MAG: scyllo-inositol 2-dehydrogenase (NADP(+)) IolU [Candidatus Celerinatantimonas neptuna]
MKIALVGSGKIVHNCLDALKQLNTIEITALCVRPQSRAKGEKLQNEHGIKTIYTDYATMLEDDDADFIYLGIPNSLHFQYAQRALQANKNVICEKPLTSNASQTQQLVELARSKNAFLFEAITSIHTPCFEYLQQNLSRLGEIKIIQCNYSQYSSRYDDYKNGEVHPVFDPIMSGGALYDINLYNVYNLVALFGAPEHVSYSCNRGFNGIDTSGTLFMQYPSFIAVCTGAKDSDSPGYMTIQGTRGYAQITDTPNTCKTMQLYIDSHHQTFSDSRYSNHMVYEFEQFESIFRRHDLKRCHQLLEQALIVSKVLEHARTQARLDFIDS